jgi:hypothetical protein
MVLGIDFSIKSAAAALKSGDIYTFYSFARKGVIKEDVKNTFAAAGVLIFETDEVTPPGKKPSIGERERASMLDARLLIPTIAKCFTQLPISYWGIEGFSFASTGNRLAQISGYQWALRWELLTGGLDIDKFQVYSPMTVKSTAGKGNYKKEEMIDAFIRSEDPLLKKNGLQLALKKMPEIFQTKRGAWMKPLDDVVDAYWVLKTVEAHTAKV